jgi:hypothetical protein
MQRTALSELASTHPKTEKYVYHEDRNYQQRSQNCKAEINHIPHCLFVLRLLLLDLFRAHQLTRRCSDSSRFLRREYRLNELLNLQNLKVSVIHRGFILENTYSATRNTYA